jgi:hypothetical protein
MGVGLPKDQRPFPIVFGSLDDLGALALRLADLHRFSEVLRLIHSLGDKSAVLINGDLTRCREQDNPWFAVTTLAPIDFTIAVMGNPLLNDLIIA